MITTSQQNLTQHRSLEPLKVSMVDDHQLLTLFNIKNYEITFNFWTDTVIKVIVAAYSHCWPLNSTMRENIVMYLLFIRY